MTKRTKRKYKVHDYNLLHNVGFTKESDIFVEKGRIILYGEVLKEGANDSLEEAIYNKIMNKFGAYLRNTFTVYLDPVKAVEYKEFIKKNKKEMKLRKVKVKRNGVWIKSQVLMSNFTHRINSIPKFLQGQKKEKIKTYDGFEIEYTFRLWYLKMSYVVETGRLIIKGEYSKDKKILGKAKHNNSDVSLAKG